jgi:hypothetical protein
MNNLEDHNYINRMYDELNNCRSSLMNDLKNDRECTKEKVINQKLQCVDNIIKNILKYRNIVIKEKLKGDL